MPERGEGASWFAFAGALVLLGLVFSWLPRASGWLGLALVLGALYGAERDAEAAGIPGPLAELGVQVERKRGA